MTSPFALIAGSWAFLQTQPALRSVRLLLVFVPLLGMTIVQRLTLPYPLVLLLSCALSILLLWGNASVLMVGKRMMQKKAGRARTSFKAVRNQSSALIVSLLLTSLLRTILTGLLLLVFIVPGIFYATRTALFSVALLEKNSIRASLQASNRMVRGKTVSVFLTLVGLYVVMFLPIGLLWFVFDWIIPETLLLAKLSADVLFVAMQSYAIVLYLLCLVQIYVELKKKPREIRPE